MLRKNISRTDHPWRLGANIMLSHLATVGFCFLVISFIMVFISSFNKGLYVGSGGEFSFLSLRDIFSAIDNKIPPNYQSYWVYSMIAFAFLPRIIHIFIIFQSIFEQKGSFLFNRIHARMNIKAERGRPYYKANNLHCISDMLLYHVTRWFAPLGIILGFLLILIPFSKILITDSLVHIMHSADDFGLQAGSWLGYLF